MPVPITSLYAGVLALILFGLSMNVIRHRWRAHVSLGDGGDKMLNKAIRVQGNFVEYVPMALILLLLSELAGAPSLALHGMGGMLLLARIMHPIGMLHSVPRLRQLGMVLTFVVFLLGGAGLVAHALW